MSGTGPQISGPTNQPIVPTRALWTWSTPVTGQPLIVEGYPPFGAPTKTGLQQPELESYIGMPIQRFGNPPIPIPTSTVTQWIRFAEDDIESETNLRLCQTWVASPPAKSKAEVNAVGLGVQNNFQQLGIDYDLADAAYDFFFERAQDEGWLYQRLRWRPVKSIEGFDPNGIVSNNFTAVKNISFIYPLLNEYFRMPPTWIVEDQNRGLIRMVPSTSVQMLPLFAMQLSFMGFAQSVPGGLWLQYTCGLTANDYNSEWSFIKELVLARAGITAFSAMQTSINFGAIETQTNIDGLARKVRYSEKGPFAAQIANLKAREEVLTRRAKSKGGGIHLGIL